ncbi:hypothetical protein JW711_00580 [Candidatus Woesearchaeota archaeon]|nr:hypothetical protein [Candidatus Woesearchaeota archaeon]
MPKQDKNPAYQANTMQQEHDLPTTIKGYEPRRSKIESFGIYLAREILGRVRERTVAPKQVSGLTSVLQSYVGKPTNFAEEMIYQGLHIAWPRIIGKIEEPHKRRR